MKYIDESILQWLGSPDDPVIRYLTIREFPEYFSGTTPLAAYSLMRNSPRITSLLNTKSDGVIGNPGRYDTLYNGTIWAFAESVSAGVSPDDPAIIKTAEFIISHAQMPSGGFTMNWAPPSESAGWSGDIIYYLIAAGYRGTQIHRAAQWLADTQRPDGGWRLNPIHSIRNALSLLFFHHSGKNHHEDYTRTSAFLPTLSCVRALSLYRSVFGGHTGSVERGIDFILSRPYLLQNRHFGGEPHYFTRSFTQISSPILFQHDLPSALHILALAGRLEDPRASVPFNLLIRKQNTDGSFPCESRPFGSLHAKYKWKKSLRDKWTTLTAYRILKSLENR